MDLNILSEFNSIAIFILIEAQNILPIFASDNIFMLASEAFWYDFNCLW